MPSLIPGYEYDVFISYRQKDNKYDSWVTEFVANLKKELEVTSKDDISVYFDENPFDGIQDGHEVNDSLNSKLKCLIFIPIISQTYCDLKSYAWNNEFLLFKESATTDKLGLKVRLKNGNVTSRMVPVRIHEPDVYDSLLLVKEIGGMLRPIDFIFQSPGVNRPLRANEDHPHDNRNKIYYRDQINKVANLIRDIIVALKSPERESEQRIISRDESPPTFSSRKLLKRPLVWGIVIAVMLMAGYTIFRSDFNSSSGPSRTTIAVIPFKVIGEENESRYFADGVMEVIRANLSMFPELKVKSRTSVERYRDSPKTITEIAKELDVLYVLEGSAQKFGDNIRVVVQLVDTRTDLNVWSEKFDKKFENVFDIQNQISEAIARALEAKITSDIAHRINKTPTDNFEVYDLFLRAKQASREYSASGDGEDLALAVHLLQRALQKDPQFALGYAWLAGLKALEGSQAVSEKKFTDSILLLANKALELDSSVVEAQLVLSKMYYLKNEDVNALRYTYYALTNDRIDSASVIDLMKRLGSVYSRIGDVDRALYFFNEILKFSPDNKEVLHLKFYALASDHRTDKLLELAEQIKKADAEDPFINLIIVHAALEGKKYPEVEKAYARQLRGSSDPDDLKNQFDLIYAWVLRKNGKEKEALRLVRKLEEQVGSDPYFKAQVLLYRGENAKGLQQLKPEEIGWYNLNLCYINPVFEKVKSDPMFKDFLSKNKSRIIGKKERVRQLEDEGYLQRPEEFAKETTGKVLSI